MYKKSSFEAEFYHSTDAFTKEKRQEWETSKSALEGIKISFDSKSPERCNKRGKREKKLVVKNLTLGKPPSELDEISVLVYRYKTY